MTTTGRTSPVEVVADEVSHTLDQVDAVAFDRLVAELRVPQRTWFCTGQGRSGLVAQMAAMRLMHLGHQAHVVGEATAPSITAADGLLVLSASGTTSVSLRFAQIARGVSATIVLITRVPASPLYQLADTVLEVPARETVQFGGSLFEQAALLVLDAAALALDSHPNTRSAMYRRHANLR